MANLRDATSPSGRIYPAIKQGAHVFHTLGDLSLDLGGLKFILRGRSSDIKKLEESMQKAVDKKVEEIRQELEESIREESMQKEVDKKVEELQQELEESIRKESHREREEEKRRVREEADGFRKRIAELQSKLEEDRHGSGKASATYTSSHTLAHPIREYFLYDCLLT